MADQKRILVVEDEPLIRLDIVTSLEANGFAVLDCANAREALNLFEGGIPIDVLFTDIDLVFGMDGVTLASTIRQTWSRVAIVVTSGHWHHADLHLPVGSRFVRKPYEHSEIVALIRELAPT